MPKAMRAAAKAPEGDEGKEGAKAMKAAAEAPNYENVWSLLELPGSSNTQHHGKEADEAAAEAKAAAEAPKAAVDEGNEGAFQFCPPGSESTWTALDDFAAAPLP